MTPMPDREETCGRERLSRFFGLSYANYLTAPRALLEQMPNEWQDQFADLLEQLDARFRWPLYDDLRIEVRLRDRRGRFVDDPLSQYRHPDPNAIAAATLERGELFHDDGATTPEGYEG